MHTVSDADLLYIENDIYRTNNCIYAARTLANTKVILDVQDTPADYQDCKYKYIDGTWQIREDWVDTSSLSEAELIDLALKEFANG